MSGVSKRMDVSRLETASLVKYSRMYRLPENLRNREELVQQVSRHLNSQQFLLNEEDLLLRFIRMVKADGLRRRPGNSVGGGGYAGRVAGKKY
ncbi:hypothetical protein DUNSADRAFT_5949 [Dunaliella salina]|uniref:Histone deacetylase complex subunit SAP30 Sin3 binding domain-containing protein n=1 Tax=Dunaliella salina TaxID=3046 RepID=A0ABQ7GPB1_DUNSA|nr:hypothetical protein DUNSADRAFT_5949 [Dunaliella salina]|eukprot:KAF5836443.1 hypothetical protein DUNSADRAFT_5949 [Dunaliella salina]